jgi:hypothetical protein
MLLKELLKFTQKTDPDYQNIQQALTKLLAATETINQNKAGADNMQKMIQIQNSIEGLSKVSVVHPSISSFLSLPYFLIHITRVGVYLNKANDSFEKALFLRSRLKAKFRNDIFSCSTTF